MSSSAGDPADAHRGPSSAVTLAPGLRDFHGPPPGKSRYPSPAISRRLDQPHGVAKPSLEAGVTAPSARVMSCLAEACAANLIRWPGQIRKIRNWSPIEFPNPAGDDAV